ncbi:immunity 22 family protein [Rossellomorea vietnamensis]|uniref:immunity 22 family protein n=1 Tax=Rossellomorea vietnamensis TaxID=218284 RepID=UPI001E3734D2|nr:immunity 22 family protein [Rossellomorea vietnamensis]MCC5803775.1 immunity 22 family protein [Rossellomorea vietnamensis]
MEKQSWVSIWLGNMNGEDSIEEYVNVTYDENGESVPSKFYNDFNIDMDEMDEDKIEKAVYKSRSSNMVTLLTGCSYEEIIVPQMKGERNFKKSYNAVILLYDFDYNELITSMGAFEFITSIRYE